MTEARFGYWTNTGIEDPIRAACGYTKNYICLTYIFINRDGTSYEFCYGIVKRLAMVSLVLIFKHVVLEMSVS